IDGGVHFHPHFFVLMLACRMRRMGLMGFSRSRVRCPMFEVRGPRFLLVYRYKFHPAFRTIARMIGYDFRMHRARKVLCFLVLMLGCRAGAVRRRVLLMRVLCDHWFARQQCNYDRDCGCNVFWHFVWL